MWLQSIYLHECTVKSPPIKILCLPIVKKSFEINILNVSSHPVDKNQNSSTILRQNYRGLKSFNMMSDTTPFFF